MVLVQKWDFFHLFIFGKIDQKKVFSDILARKNSFLDYKNKKQKKKQKQKTKNRPFSTWVSPWFSSKVFGDILERKKAFIAYKNKE